MNKHVSKKEMKIHPVLKYITSVGRKNKSSALFGSFFVTNILIIDNKKKGFTKKQLLASSLLSWPSHNWTKTTRSTEYFRKMGLAACSGERSLQALGLADFGLQGVAGLLGVAQQHGRVGFVEDGVVDGGVSHAQRTLHHNHLL